MRSNALEVKTFPISFLIWTLDSTIYKNSFIYNSFNYIYIKTILHYIYIICNPTQERNDFWCPPDCILDWYKKIRYQSKIQRYIHWKDDILKEINDKFTPSEDVAPPFYTPKFPNSWWSSIKESTHDCYKQKSLYSIQAKVFSSIKPVIFILESCKDDEIKTQITSVIQMLCPTIL